MTATQLSFLIAITLLTLTPGFDTALVLRTSATEGWRRASASALGVTLGCLLWGIAVGAGLGALLLASETVYHWLKGLGAAYLLWLGVSLLLKPRNALQSAEDSSRAAAGYLTHFRRGLLGNLLNPKIGVFYVTFLPQFIPAGASVPLWCTLMALTHMVIGLVWNGLLIAGSHYFARRLRQPGMIKIMDRVTGCVFIAFAAKLALSRR